MKERRSKQTEEEKRSEEDIARAAMKKFRAASKEGIDKEIKLCKYNEREENRKRIRNLRNNESEKEK